ncbi:MAG: IS66 family transposase [Cellvibrionales bacterium]|nr:IS66 family transposase [Cellvibrionales bacterium]
MSNEAKLFEENNRLTARINLLEQTLATTKVENATLQEKYDGLLETVKLANQRKFSPSTEANILQQNLFDEVGVASSEPGEQNAKDKTGTTTYTVTRKKKNHPTRKPLPEHLPRVKTILEPTEADKMCSCGCQREQMGQEVTEELIVEPAKVLVNQIIRPKMVCKNKDCDNDKIIIVPLLRLLPKTNASPSLIADIVTKKYVDHLPLYRQEKIWERLDIILPRNLLCGWLMMTADKCEPLYKLLNQYLLGYDVVHADETTAQVLKEMGRTSKQKSYIWSYKGGPPDKSVVIFEYQETRENKHPIKFLTGFAGYIMTDAYTGYDWIGRKEFESSIRVF